MPSLRISSRSRARCAQSVNCDERREVEALARRPAPIQASSRARRSSKGSARRSSPSSTAYRRGGRAREAPSASCGVTALRFSRCCRSLNGATRLARARTSSSPSSTPSKSIASTMSGKAPEMSSPARLYSRVTPPERGDLDADAVPFPFGAEVRGIERVELGALDGVGEHQREEGARMLLLGLRAPSFAARRTAGGRAGRGRARPPRPR